MSLGVKLFFNSKFVFSVLLPDQKLPLFQTGLLMDEKLILKDWNIDEEKCISTFSNYRKPAILDIPKIAHWPDN